MENEIWKNIDDRHQISNFGNVRSVNYKNTGQVKLLKQSINNNGYPIIGLSSNGKTKNYTVHRLVAQAFLPNPDNLPEVNHKNEIKTDNFVYINDDWSVDLEKSNLEFCDRFYNINYGTKKERTKKRLIETTKIRKPINQYALDGTFIKSWSSATEASLSLGLCCSHICKCCRGERKSCGGFKWLWIE